MSTEPGEVRGESKAVIQPPATPPVKVWAAIGALFVAFGAYLILRWVSGPYFEPVSNDATQPPDWMKAVLIAWQVVSIPAALIVLHWTVVRPWRRERRIGVDGMIALAAATLWVQDISSNAAGPWIVYNTWLVNVGSWTPYIPWWSSFGEPGAMTSYPILFDPAAYVYTFVIVAVLGCWVMRAIRRHRPATSAPVLILGCFAFMCALDFVLEAFIWLPLGVFEYPGGHWSVFPSTYHKFPLSEMFTIGSVFTAVACLRFFTNDRGETIAERGIEKVKASSQAKLLIRALATAGAVNLAFLLGYNVPNTAVGAKSTAWPAALQERSYFLNNLCGEGTGRFCPGPNAPTIRKRSIYPSAGGAVVVPEGTRPPEIIPFDTGDRPESGG